MFCYHVVYADVSSRMLEKETAFLFYEEVIVEDIICFSFSVYLKANRAEVKDPIEACGVPHLYTARQE